MTRWRQLLPVCGRPDERSAAVRFLPLHPVFLPLWCPTGTTWELTVCGTCLGSGIQAPSDLWAGPGPYTHCACRECLGSGLSRETPFDIARARQAHFDVQAGLLSNLRESPRATEPP